MIRSIGSAIALLVLLTQVAAAQSTTNPGASWHGSWSFSTTADQSLKLLRADLMKKAESGYYDEVGKSTVYVTNNVDNRSGVVEVQGGDGAQIEVNNHNGDEIGQNTNVIGAVNSSTTTIDISGNNNQVSTVNDAESTGCQDGSINISTLTGSSTTAGSITGGATGGGSSSSTSSGATSCN